MRLNQVTVFSNDVPAAVEFYRRLGLRLIVDARPRYARFECPEGDSTFSVEHSDEPVSRNRTTVYFECDDVDERFMSLKDQGILFDHPPVDQPWLWREARLRDPAGNVICLFHAGENRRNPPWRVKDEVNTRGDSDQHP